MMKTFEIWSEGYLATGMEGIPAPARFFGKEKGQDFRTACIAFFAKQPSDPYAPPGGFFDPHYLTYWGCKLFDNEAEARKSFG